MTGNLSRRAALALGVGGLAMAAAAGAEPNVDPSDGAGDRALVEAAGAGAPLAALLARTASDLRPDSGGAFVWREQVLFVARSADAPALRLDEGAPLAMISAGLDYWTRLERLRVGATRNFVFEAGGRRFGAGSVAGYGPDSYRLPQAARGALSPMRTVTSTLYGGAVSDYWLYVNAGADERRGAPLMIWFDGAMHVGERDYRAFRLQAVTDNLVHRGAIPPMVHLLIQPGRGGPPLAPQFAGQAQDNAMRSLQYDTFTDLFARHIEDEVLPQVEAEVKLRQDAYSRGAAGQSSGAVAAFKLGWFRPGGFTRVHSTIGSYTGLQWRPEDHLDGANVAPLRIRREPKRNLRIWLSDGANDLDVDADGRADLYGAGSWPLANIAMAQALKSRLYDFHFRFGRAAHNPAQGGLDLPQSLAWLWRGYDPERTSQIFEQEAAERARPPFRVTIANREAW